jgi:hypothetical protein
MKLGLLVLMGGRAEGLACADPVARTPIGASGNYFISYNVSLVFYILSTCTQVFVRSVGQAKQINTHLHTIAE